MAADETADERVDRVGRVVTEVVRLITDLRSGDEAAMVLGFVINDVAAMADDPVRFVAATVGHLPLARVVVLPEPLPRTRH